MYLTSTVHTLAPTEFLNKIYPNGLPVNTFLDKGRCAIGATTIELIFKERCSLIVVPNTSILLDKEISHPEIDIIYGEVHYANVVDKLRHIKQGHKIMTTPDGIWKVFKAAEEVGRLNELYNEWFLLLDEAHTFITEIFRGDAMLRPFNYFWKFKHRSLMSATPYIFSNPKFEELHHVQIKFTSKIGKVSLVNCRSIDATLNWILEHRDEYPGNLHIFFNSVTEIRLAINRANLNDCAIFCANDKENGNLIKLGDLAKFHCPQPGTGKYRKINFYTCKYFEGWDLYDDNATIILVTNVNKVHTKVAVSMKGKQAIGRLRNIERHETMHLTNHHYNKYMKTITEFKADFILEANYSINLSNQYIAFCNQNNLPKKAHDGIDKYADIDKYTQLALLNWEKLDQQINNAACAEVYNHINYIKQAWEDAYYEVELSYSDLQVETATNHKRKSAAKQLEEDYKQLITQNQSGRQITLSLNASITDYIKKTNPQAYKASELIEETTMEKLKYNIKKVDAEIIARENSSSEFKLRQMLNLKFKIGSKYTNVEIKEKMQAIYNFLEIKNPNGTIKIAKASQLSEKGLFEVENCKLTDKLGETAHGKRILRAQFSLRMAA
jgi:uncharacterized protein YxjI